MITLNTIQQEHIADLIIQHRHASVSEDSLFTKWLETDSELARKAFRKAAQRRHTIEAELAERYGIDLQAATTRRIKKATAA